MSPSSPATARARLVSRVILAAGLAAAVVIYVVNGRAPGASGFELEESKKYLRDVEVVGGKANLLATQLRHWFSGLWHGRSLAFTVAVLSVLAASAYEFLATPLPAHTEGEASRKDT